MYQTSQYSALHQSNTRVAYSPLENIAQNAVSYSSPSLSQNQMRVQYSISARALNDVYSLAGSFSSSLHLNSTMLYAAQLQSYNSAAPQHYISFTPQAEYHFEPNNFLRQGNWGSFVGKAEEVQGFVKEAFEIMFGTKFPEHIRVQILDNKEFRELAPNPGVIGLSINRSHQGLPSDVFVKNDYLARVMLTLGHELGHVLTPTLKNSQDEEAKAYAFSFAWMKVLKEHDIAGLQEAIVTENPARNGLHDVALAFVARMLEKGESAWSIYQNVVNGAACVAAS